MPIDFILPDHIRKTSERLLTAIEFADNCFKA
jgi:hypothetical protein